MFTIIALTGFIAAAEATRVHPFRAERNFMCRLCTETLTLARDGNEKEVDRIMELFPAFYKQTLGHHENADKVNPQDIEGSCQALEFCAEDALTELFLDERPLDLSAHIEKVNSNANSTWTAGVNDKFEGASLGQIQMTLGTIVDPKWTLPTHKKEAVISMDSVPTDFDSRTNWPDCESVINHVRDQSDCGSCWAFGTTEALNDRQCISNGFKGLLSTSDTTGCCDFTHCFSMGCNGGQVGTPWNWFKGTGVVTGGDFDDSKYCYAYTMPACAHHVTDPSLPSCDAVTQV